jgi:nitrite reductase (NADH) large subunit
VKTCVGTDHCRFGTQDSTGLGIRAGTDPWGSWTPHKVKLAVSGCPRNCAEATCKDVGIVCVDSGYQVGVAGAAGMDVKETERLADVPTEQEAIDLTVAFIQLYRENAAISTGPTNGWPRWGSTGCRRVWSRTATSARV